MIGRNILLIIEAQNDLKKLFLMLKVRLNVLKRNNKSSPTLLCQRRE
jgi:hypothetical protein